MANPLQSSPQPDAPLQAPPMQQPGMAPSQGGQGAPVQAGAPAGAPQQQPPAPPSHAQTVATLRHLHAINAEFAPVLKDPDLGKTDAKSAIIDATTHLVAGRIVSPAAAVMLLSQVPTDPLDQRKWLQKFYDSNEQAALTVLDHHASAGGNLDWRADQAQFAPHDPGGHMKTMDGVMAHYKGGGHG